MSENASITPVDAILHCRETDGCDPNFGCLCPCDACEEAVKHDPPTEWELGAYD